tara:strand:- start:235 stop:372 length:138 start_codon:yes stop_codon:yes gene_type:complete
MVDPAVLEAGMPEPEPMPEPAPSLEEELMDPIQDVNAMMAQLDQG